MRHAWYLLRGFGLFLGLGVAIVVCLGLPIGGLLFLLFWLGGKTLLGTVLGACIVGAVLGLSYQMGTEAMFWRP